MKNKNKGINFKILLPIILLIVLSVLGYNQIFKTPSIIMEDMSQSIPIQNRDHINQSETLQVYNSNPPTSGPHAGAIKGGFYSEEILDINGVHNLEHGYIWITYQKHKS